MLADLRELIDVSLRLTAVFVPQAASPEACHQLLRILREAINNAAHHAAAGQPAPGHFGLRGLQERASRIGAGVEIDSRPGAGTTITIRVPSRAGTSASGPPQLGGR